jgi:hypothetical protein
MQWSGVTLPKGGVRGPADRVLRVRFEVERRQADCDQLEQPAALVLIAAVLSRPAAAERAPAARVRGRCRGARIPTTSGSGARPRSWLGAVRPARTGVPWRSRSPSGRASVRRGRCPRSYSLRPGRRRRAPSPEVKAAASTDCVAAAAAASVWTRTRPTSWPKRASIWARTSVGSALPGRRSTARTGFLSPLCTAPPSGTTSRRRDGLPVGGRRFN